MENNDIKYGAIIAIFIMAFLALMAWVAQ